jgi:uncharacterized protein YjdB
MRKNLILLPLACVMGYLMLTSNSTGPAFMSSEERTGVTGVSNCGGGSCHSSASVSSSINTTVQLLLAGVPVTSYTPGGSYTIRVMGTNTSSSSTAIFPRFGYQLTAVKGSPATTAGILSAPTGSHNSLISSVNIIEHNSPIVCVGSGGPGSSYPVDIAWTAPAAGTGIVSIRATINAVNFNGNSAGDVSANALLTVTEATTSVAPITGTLALCVGGTTTLSDATAGGTWTSSVPGVATIGSATGIVTGITPGTSVINYVTGTGSATATVTVNPNPGAITGTPAVCPGGTTPLSATPAGGTWSSASTAIATVNTATGVVTGVTSGTTTISYALVTGCYSTMEITVNTVPAITGTGTMCTGATTTLTHPIPGGAWSSSTPAVATVSTGGIVSGISGGTATISYTFGTSGCFAATVVTVIGTPSVTGSATVCVGLTTTLTAMPAGGTWASSNTAKATVGSSSGIVTGISAGTATIKYKVTSSCGTDSATFAMTVTPASSCATGIVNLEPAQVGGLHIYPNPNSGRFTLNVISETNEPARILIADMTGKLVQETTLITNSNAELIINQPRGIYFVSATTLLHKYIVKVVIE